MLVFSLDHGFESASGRIYEGVSQGYPRETSAWGSYRDKFSDEEIVIKDGRKQKPKKIIIIGYDKDNDTYYGSVFINTKINPKAGISNEVLASQYLIKQADYESFLRYDSYVDCAGIISCSSEKLLSGDYYGTLNEDDRKNIWDILETTDTLTTKLKKRFGIKRR